MDHSEVKHLPKVDHTPADLDEVSMRLLAAAALIEKNGHWNGGVHKGGTCVVLAIKDAGLYQWDKVYDDARDRFARAVGIDDKWLVCELLYAWNDARTKDEVCAKLRAVALGL